MQQGGDNDDDVTYDDVNGLHSLLIEARAHRLGRLRREQHHDLRIFGSILIWILLGFLRTVSWFDLFWDFQLFSENKFSVLVLLARHTFHLLSAIVPGNDHFFTKQGLIWTSFTSQNVVKTCLVLECTPSPHAKPPPPRSGSCPRQAAQRRQGSRSPQVWDFPPWRQKWLSDVLGDAT